MCSTVECRSGCQSTSPLRGPLWCRQGKDSPAARNALTTAVADPVASNVASRCRTAPWMAASGSRTTCPAASQTSPDEMELSLRHLPLHAQEQAVVKVPRVVEPVFVADQGAGHGTDLQELMPVGVVAGQPGAFQAEHDPGPAQ